MEKRIYQRRAVYTVLKEWLDEDRVLEALQVFEESFQGRPTPAIHEYLMQIAPLYRDRVDTRTLRHGLMQMLVRQSPDLAPDPLPLLNRFRKAGQNRNGLPELQPSAEQLALHELVSNIMRKLKPTQRKMMHTFIANQLRQRFVNGTFDLLAQYLLSDNPSYLAGLDERSLQDFFNALYVAACEVVGPVSADKWFAGTLNSFYQEAANGEAVYRYL